MYMKFQTSLSLQLCTYCAFFPLILAATKTVSFSDKTDCKAYRHYFESGSDVYKVIWNGESYPTFCSLRFTMRGIDTYKMCAKVTTFNMECERSGDEKRQLKFYWGVSQKEKYYDCNDRLPITYCHEDLLYMHLEPRYRDIKRSNSKIRITVTAELISKYGDSFSSSSSSNTGIIVGVIVGITIFVFIICLAICKRQAAARQNASNVLVQRQGNNVYVATTAPYQQNQLSQPMGYQHQQQHGEQSVPLVQYPGGSTSYPYQYPPMSAGQSSQPSYQPMPAGQTTQPCYPPMSAGQSSQPGYPPMSASQSSQPGYYGNMQSASAPVNQNYYGKQVQYPTQNQQPNESKSIASAPPPSYSDVMEKGTGFQS